MTYLRYWAIVGFLLIGAAVLSGVPDFTNKWPHVVVGFLVLPLTWALHYLQKKPLSWREPEFWAWLALAGTLVNTLFAGNVYAASLGWLVVAIGLVVFMAVRTLAQDHRQVLQVGVLLLGALWVGWAMLATHTSLPIPWVPAVAKDPVALAALAVPPLVAGFMLLKRQAFWKNCILLFAVVVCIAPFVLPSFYIRIQQDWQQTAVLTQAFASMATSNAGFGVGADNATYEYLVSAPVPSVLADRAPSTVLDIVSSFGIFGTLMLIAILATTLLALRGRSRRTKIVMLAAVGVSQALCWVANVWQYPGVWFGWWVLLGLCAAPLPTVEIRGGDTRRYFRVVSISLSTLIAAQALVMGLGLNRFAAAERMALSGDTKKAASLYAFSLRFDPDPEQRRAYAESLWLNNYQSKELDEAAKQARLAYDWNRHDAFARQIGARVAFSQGHNADAERLYRETLDRDPYFSLEVYLLFSDVYAKQKKTAEARAVLLEGLARYPANPTAGDVPNPVFLQQLQKLRDRVEFLDKQE